MGSRVLQRFQRCLVFILYECTYTCSSPNNEGYNVDEDDTSAVEGHELLNQWIHGRLLPTDRPADSRP